MESKCFVCFNLHLVKKGVSDYDKCLDGAWNKLFVLKRIFEIPNNVLESDGRKLGSQIGGGEDEQALLCEQCSVEMAKACNLLQQLLELAREFRNVQKTLVEVIRRSSGPEEKWRAFVKEGE